MPELQSYRRDKGRTTRSGAWPFSVALRGRLTSRESHACKGLIEEPDFDKRYHRDSVPSFSSS